MSPPPPWGTSLEGLPLCKSLGSFAEQVDWPFWMIWFFWKDKGVSGLMGIWEEMLSLLWKLTPFGMSSFHMFHVPVPDVWMNSMKYRQVFNLNDSSTMHNTLWPHLHRLISWGIGWLESLSVLRLFSRVTKPGLRESWSCCCAPRLITQPPMVTYKSHIAL